MSVIPGEGLIKVTINLYADDVARFKARYGFGYSEAIRLLCRAQVKAWDRASDEMRGKQSNDQS